MRMKNFSRVTLTEKNLERRCLKVPSDIGKALEKYNIAGLILRDSHGVGYSEVLEPEQPEGLNITIPSLLIGSKDYFKIVDRSKTEEVIANLKRPSKFYL